MTKMKVVRITYKQVIQAPLHVVDAFEIQRQTSIIEPLEDFLRDSQATTLQQLDLGDYLAFEVIEMAEQEFKQLKEFSPVV
jgi:hypothetical protein